jgi:hypothetical protein
VLEREVEKIGHGDLALKAATERLNEYMGAFGGSEGLGRYGS